MCRCSPEVRAGRSLGTCIYQRHRTRMTSGVSKPEFPRRLSFTPGGNSPSSRCGKRSHRRFRWECYWRALAIGTACPSAPPSPNFACNTWPTLSLRLPFEIQENSPCRPRREKMDVVLLLNVYRGVCESPAYIGEGVGAASAGGDQEGCRLASGQPGDVMVTFRRRAGAASPPRREPDRTACGRVAFDRMAEERIQPTKY